MISNLTYFRYLAYVAYAVLEVVCIVCNASYIVNFALLGLGYWTNIRCGQTQYACYN